MAKVTSIGKKTEPAAAVDPAIIEKAAEESARMGRSERVFFWDKRQGAKVWAGADDHVLTAAELEADEQALTIKSVVDAVPGTRPALNRHHLVTAPTVLRCGNDKSHGPLVINGAGSLLLCGAHKGGAPCTYNQPVSI